MQSVDFYQLERPAQERFIGSLTGKGLPTPIVFAASAPLAPRLYLAGSVGCGVAFLALLVSGYGNVASGIAIQGPGCLVAEIILAGLAVFGLVRAAVLAQDDRASPFRRGLYVFPIGLIDARTPGLRVYPIGDLTGVFGPDVRGVTLDFGGQSFSFPVTDAAAAETIKEQLASARTAVSDAVGARESIRPKALAALDPLQGYANPLSSSHRMTRVTPGWARFGWAIAAGAGAVVALSLWALRNDRSDESMFQQATAAGDAESLRAYLGKGKKHAREVESVLLPRALLKEVVKTGTVDAIDEFLKAHPTGPIAREARAALKVALLAELDVASKAGTLAALDEFSHRRDHTLVDPELAAARHAVYEAALARYLAMAPDKGSQGALLVQRMIAWSEKKGPKVELRFRNQRSKTMDKADRAATQSRQWKGVVSLPSRYFDDAAEKADRDALAAAIAQRFGEAFTPDILSVTVGAPLPDSDAPLPAAITVPTLFVDLSAIWAGSVQASQKPRGVYVGLDLTFDGVFRTPDDPHGVRVRHDVWRVPELYAARDADKPEDTVYGAMRTKAFEQFQKKLLAAFFAAK